MTTGPVTLERHGRGAHVVIANPPVNALSHAVRQGMHEAVRAAIADPGVAYVVIRAAGRTFVAGGDIAEFGGPIQPPDTNDVFNLIEASEKPVVAALHGTAVGGGLELALACHGRIAAPGTRLGLPEVNLGLLPGAGGTRRLPRAIGLEPALDMILSGSLIPADKARELGLIDGIADGDLSAAAEQLAVSLVGASLEGRRLGARPLPAGDLDAAPAILAAARARVAREWPWSTGRRAAIEAAEVSLTGLLQAALTHERALFDGCRSSDQGQALIHLFFAERAAVKVPASAGAATPAAISRVGIVGAGTMGRGIAIVFAAAGFPTVVFERVPEIRTAAREGIDTYFRSQAQRGRLSPEAAERAAAAVTLVSTIDDLHGSDLVVEAAFEQMAVKLEVFAALDRITRPGTILATNTSSLDVEAIARATGRPGSVLGLHFFSPAPVMRLLEIVRTGLTEAATLHSAAEVARRIGKTGVVVGNCFGFVANRMIFEYQRQGEFLVEDGATPEQVDRALVEFGMPMGPFAMADMAGLDVAWLLRKEFAHLQPADRRRTGLADLICERRCFGQKTGRGWFRYDAGGRRPLPHPEVDELITAERRRLGIMPREVTDDEIRERCLYALVNEAARILEEGIATRPGDIDVIYVQGFGFPRWRGGPLHWADRTGIGQVHARLQHYFKTGDRWLEPAPLLSRMAAEGVDFADLETRGWLKR